MTIKPPFLKSGDKVALVAPAKCIEEKYILNAVSILNSWGLEVDLGRHTLSQSGSLAGTDSQRSADLQAAMDNPHIKAIFCARGGYGSIRIIDNLDFTKFYHNPKWIIGYSDITVIQTHLLRNYQVASLHGEMPLKYPAFPSSNKSMESLKSLLFGEIKPIRIQSHPLNRSGLCFGELTGGNLAILCSLLGSESDIQTKGKILFLEDIGEHLYQIDRMVLSLKRAGKLNGLAGLMIGQFTDIEEGNPSFGQSLEEIIMSHVQEYDYPVIFNFPAGHIEDNEAFIFGQTYRIEITDNYAELSL